MKRIFAPLFVSLAVMCSLASCNSDITTTTPKGDNGDEEIDLSGYTMLEEAECVNYGDYAENGTTNFYLILSKEVTENGETYTYAAVADLYAEKDAETLPLGTYTASSTYAKGTFAIANEDEEGYYDGTLYYKVQGEDEDAEVIAAFNKGEVRISLKEAAYTITMDLKEGDTEYKFAYQGEITFVDDDDEDDDDDDEDLGDVVFDPDFVYAYNYGQDYGDMGVNYADWVLYLYQETSEDYVELDFFASGTLDPAELPTGEYKIKDDGESYLYEPGCAIPFYYDEEYGVGYGCHYGHGEYYWYCATDGTITITKEGGDYVLAYNMYDAEADAVFSGKYKGAIQVEDASDDYAAASRVSVKQSKPSTHEKVYSNIDGRNRGHIKLR